MSGRSWWSVMGLSSIAKIESLRGHGPHQVDGRRLPALDFIDSHEQLRLYFLNMSNPVYIPLKIEVFRRGVKSTNISLFTN